MRYTALDIDARIDAAIATRDAKALDQLLNELFKPAKHAPAAFTPAVELRQDVRESLEAGATERGEALEADIGLDLLNRISRAQRRIQYELKVLGGFDGLRIVSEGDSWFQYPIRLRDIIDVLSEDDDKAIMSLDATGDEVAEMAAQGEWAAVLAETGAHAFLLSAGGNDLLGDGRLAGVLKTFSAGGRAEDVIDEAALRSRIDAVVGAYRQIVAGVAERHPTVAILGHGYDLPHPQQSGRWLGKPLQQRRIPLQVGRAAIAIILDRFNEALAGLMREFPSYRHVDLRRKVDRGPRSWFDELHPHNPGYARAAEAFREQLSRVSAGARTMARAAGRLPVEGVVAGAPAAARARPARAAGEVEGRAMARGTVVIDPGHGGTSNLECSSANNATGPIHGTLEKTLTLDVALRVKAELERRGGFNVILTRDGDINLSGVNRARTARLHNADVLISIHFNASERHNAQGTETFVHTRHADTGSSARLCRAVQAAVLRATGLNDRNRNHPPHFIKKAGFCVINPRDHAANTAAVLTEVSFLDRADEEERLQRDSYKSEIAIAIANGIETYLGSGFEAEAAVAEAEDHLEDAISLAAAEAGITVDEMRDLAGGAPAEEPRAYRGHHLADEEPATAAADQPARRPLPQLARLIAAREPIADAANDVHEFASTPIGDAPDFAAARGNEAAALSLVERMFARVPTVELESFDLGAFESFVRELGLQHFAAEEFLFLGASNQSGPCAGKNALPPQSLWRNITGTAIMLDRIRSILGAPIKLLSCYRNQAYNACIGGAGGSHHKRFNAIDWRCSAGTVERWREVARQVRGSDPRFAGGIGFYPDSRFIHIDTRGSNADW